MLYALILAGGKGTRLYPLSRSKNPKQFLKVINNKSFLRNTMDRITLTIPKESVYVVTNEDYIEKIYEELPEVDKGNIFVEPSNKETATCIGLSAVKLLKKDKDATMIILPSDHYIDNVQSFNDAISQALEVAEKKRGLVTIGIPPSRAETGYGYIQMGERIYSNVPTYKVERFSEKPNLEVAKDFLSKGNFLWNSGIFIWRADVFLREMEKYLPKMYKSMMTIYQNIDTENEIDTIKTQYSLIEGISVDFGIMQKTRKCYVIRGEFIWDDIGSFAALSRFIKKCDNNNIYGEAFLEQSENCFVYSKDKLVIGFGLKDIVAIDAGDIMLIMDKNKDQDIKYLVDQLKNNEDFAKYL